ncbi:MAG TPA: hypothetical protein VFR67_11935 [Pilimelia sp.]|nr:hypothetical protein [Pilimelia sp.]
MGRRQLAAALAVGAVAALIASLGLRHADAGQSPDAPKHYPPCAVGEFTAELTVTASGEPALAMAGWIAPCQRLPFDPRQFAWEIREYSNISYPVVRKPFTAWSEATPFTVEVPLRAQARALCLAYGGGVERRLQCVQVTPPEGGGSWTVAPISPQDPLLDVPDLQVMPPQTQHPDPICANCP